MYSGAIWAEMQELLEHSVYEVVGNQGQVIYEKFPVSLKNEDDRLTFEAMEYSKKYRQTLTKAKDEIKPEKPPYNDSGTDLYIRQEHGAVGMVPGEGDKTKCY